MHYANILLGHPLVGAASAGMGPADYGLGFIPAAIFGVIIVLAIVWTLIWKGIALWTAARNHQTIWFVVLLILNTLGILEIIYLLFFRKDKNTTVVVAAPTPAPAAQVE